MSVRIGIDLGGTKIEIIAIDQRNNTLLRKRVATPQGDYQGILEAIASLVRDAERALGPAASIGIGTPGAESRETGLMKNANSTVLIGKAFRRDLERLLERRVRMTNDANCLVMSESVDGAAAGMHAVFGAILGTGVGGGIAIASHILEGPNAIAGEWGHNPLPWPRGSELPGPACYCGKYGCIETFLSGPGFEREYRRAAGNGASAASIVERAEGGDPHALQTLELYEDRLARALATVINVLDPDAIVLGGGMSNVERFYASVPALLPRYVFSDSVRTKIVRAAHGDSSGVRGAAMLE